MKKFVLVCGSRNWTDRAAIHREMLPLSAGTVIIHGGCKGADNISGEVAKELGLDIVVYPANWGLYGKAAGPKRNTQMLNRLIEERDNGNDVSALAFHGDLGGSRGTLNMVSKLIAAGIKYEVIEK